MRTRRARLALSGILVLLGAVGACGAAGTPPPSRSTSAAHAGQVRPLELPRGAGPRVPVLVDDTIVTPQGTIPLRFSGHDREAALLGEVDGRFVIGVTAGADTQFWSVPRHGAATKLGPPRTYYDASPMMAAGRILVSYSDRGTVRTTMTQVDARTGATLHTLAGSALIPLSMGERGVVLAGGGTTNTVKLWRPDGSLESLFSTGSQLLVPMYVGLDRGLVVNEDIDHDVYRAAFTTLDAPRSTRWSTPNGSLLAVSPSGRYVVINPPTADGSNSQKAIELRRLSDGHLVHRFSFDRYLAWPAATFEDEHTFLVAASAPRQREVLVRCTDAGRCERAGATARSVRLPSAGEL